MATTTKKEIIDRIAQSTQMHRDQVRLVVKEFLEQLVNEIGEGNRLEFREFGVFEVKVRGPRQAQNPKTLEPVMVERRRTVKFKPGLKMREALAAAAPESLVEPKPARRAKAAQEGELKMAAPVGAAENGAL
ncbi:MAG: integration host factor subunit beta [Phycisphaeraceae bacterium]|nr:integration host factor subunit beta [Phycisphaeraceae bacterium]